MRKVCERLLLELDYLSLSKTVEIAFQVECAVNCATQRAALQMHATATQQAVQMWQQPDGLTDTDPGPSVQQTQWQCVRP